MKKSKNGSMNKKSVEKEGKEIKEKKKTEQSVHRPIHNHQKSENDLKGF